MLLAGTFTAVPFLSSAAFADRPFWTGNPHNPGNGNSVVVMTEDTPDTCDPSQTPSSTKGGLSVRFIVPSTITDIENSGEPHKGVNTHVAFIGDEDNYYEAGIIYGDTWTEDPNLPNYDREEFHFYWGQGGEISGVSTTLPVVAGHDVRVSLLYLESQGEWQAWFEDITSDGLEAHDIDANTELVASDYALAVETNGVGPNDNSELLGEVQIKDLEYATRISGDGVSLSNWPDAFFTTCFGSFLNGDYGVDDNTATGVFRMGYGADHTNNGYQLW